MTGCQKHIVDANAIEVYIEKLDSDQIYKITCREKINKIIYTINSSKREFRIFIPNVKVVLIYKNGKRTSFRIFRDREELAAKDLSTSIEEALMESHFLLLRKLI